MKKFVFGYEAARKEEQMSSNPKFHRTEREDDLSFSFEMKYKNEVSKMENKFDSLYRDAYVVNDLSERIELLRQSASAFEDAKKFCYSKGKGGTIYFQDMWECLHNSRNDCFSYLDKINEGLNQSLLERDTIIPSIFCAINESDGILQKDIYKELPDVSKSDIQRVIRALESEGKIKRTKKSNSYMLEIVD